ncbi:conserved hypothetical protein [Pediculus humanus corporis]|uniref:MANSC domain-containing protein n=1 Tax=Pediculus humanus subsp. corporis TaxID=121224 RepID=E0VZG2_PEDHC|nr:uncharacterized protein Phum_PHUM532120 [Pediculus humanus corporis]EEB18768.1 conserved hypothetical protein [Pediculus humanus corporis]
MLNLNVILLIFSIVSNAKSVGDRENGFENRKRFDMGTETCIENFDIHIDKIIRTQDSRAMGAKYLNEADVNGREDCMKLCCETSLCDVFVMEQKVPGSCYLFHCGSPEDFKCKFTQHKNYTSAVLAFNTRIGDIENRMKLTKHEEELTMLRKLYPSIDSTTTASPLTTKVPTVSGGKEKQNHSSKSSCSRYQFECRGSGECIAIYNACDGIPQCNDGSDEGPELDCPTISEPVQQIKDTILKGKLIPEQQTSLKYFPFGYPQQVEQQQQQQQQQQGQNVETNRQKIDTIQQQIPNQPRYYGREGEMVQYPINNVQWQGYQPRHESGYVANRKGSSAFTPENSESQLPAPYGNDMSRTEYMKYGGASSANNNYYSGSGPIYYPGQNNWMQRVPPPPPPPPPPHAVDDIQQRPIISLYGNGMQSGSIQSDYYYEDPQLKGRYPQGSLELSRLRNSENFQQKNYQSIIPMNKSPILDDESKKKDSDTRIAEHLRMIQNDMKEIDGVNERPSGAILSLTLGMCITAIMITLVGCRLRVVRKRMRRNGKSPFAHDADFLVNGMYL